MPASSIIVIDAPSNLGLRPLRAGHIPGAWRLSSALRAHGLMALPGMLDAGSIPAPAYNPDGEPAYGFRHGRELREYSTRLARGIGSALENEMFTLVLGGDCSILVGTGLALKQRGRYGLVFIDGHTDYPFPRHSQRFTKHGFTAAGLDLGLATGHGPKELVDIDGQAPYFNEHDVVVFGYRYEGDAQSHDLTDWQRSAILKQPLERLRSVGIEHTVRETLDHLEQRGIDGIWLHLDADVLDPIVMPAVDSPEDAGGMTFEELEHALSLLLQSPHVIGLEFTIFDPDLDPDGRLAKRWVELLDRVLPRRAKKHTGR